jgi:aminopeptidase N/puromycin-sensitive aminopeptidase
LQDGVNIRVCATPDKAGLTAYALAVAQFALHYYNDYFGIPYPLKKLDLIALPDFEAGAMENFGAITFRETELLLDPQTASVQTRQNVALVIAHEMAHQWFGDLVTMQWWNNVWLNEGFAEWMENKAVAAMHPEWDIPLGVAQKEQRTLDLDAQRTTRTIRAKADTPDQINQMFDAISYGKASDVLLTVENFLGAETFRKGVHAYLAAHLYGNATAEDFWNAQTAVSHKPVDKIMDSFIAQPGEPLLIFSKPANGRVAVQQNRFFLDPRSKDDAAQRWTLPVCFKSNARKACEVLAPAGSTLSVPRTPLFFANAEGKGYYRTAYAPAEYAKLVAQLETGLTPAERISLAGDEWVRVRANQVAVGDYLELVTALKDDGNADVIATALTNVDTIYERLAATPEERTQLAAWIDHTFAPILIKLGPAAASDDDNTRALRAKLLITVGTYGSSAQVVGMAHRIANQYLADPASVEATVGQAALTVSAREGDAAWFDRLQKTYESSDDPEFKTSALQLLAQFRAPDLVKRSLDYAMSAKVRSQDAANQFVIPLGNNETRDVAWDYLKSHWDQVRAQLTISTGQVFIAYTGYFCSSAARDDVKNFFATHEIPASDAYLQHALEVIDGCIEFRSLQEQNLKSWLAAQPEL